MKKRGGGVGWRDRWVGVPQGSGVVSLEYQEVRRGQGVDVTRQDDDDGMMDGDWM